MAYNADGSKNVNATKRTFYQVVKEKLFSVKTLQIKETIKHVDQAAQFDLCFMVDCTGSMGSHINGVKEKIKGLTADIHKRYPDSNGRLAFVGYRDYGDSYAGLLLDFVDNVDTFYNHLDKIVVSGGGDMCEDIVKGFNIVNQLKWANFTKILIHIADAPSHGRRYHLNCNDDHPNEQPDFRTEFQQLYNKGVHYHFYKINDHTNKMISEFRVEAPVHMVIKESDCFEASGLAKTLKFSTSYSISYSLDSELTKG